MAVKRQMIPGLRSDQEQNLENLMHDAFGSQAVYAPKNYKRGRQEKEPCDIFWAVGRTVFLIYATAGRQSLASQENHNAKQASTWARYWISNAAIKLSGTNRYQDSVSLALEDVDTTIFFFVTSQLCGIRFHKSPIPNKIGFACTVPETFIYSVLNFGGTVVDLLEMVREYSKNLGRHLRAHQPTGYERLQVVMRQQYRVTRETLENLQRKNEISLEKLQLVSTALYQIVNHPGDDDSEETLERRQNTMRYFGDMSSRQFTALTHHCLQTIEATEDCVKTKCGVISEKSFFWVIIATSLRANNMGVLMDQMMKEVKAKTGRDPVPLIVYAYDFPGMPLSYLSPMTIALPPSADTEQINLLIREIESKQPKVQR